MVTRKFCPRPFLHLDYHIADYYHPLTSHCFCGIIEEDTFATNYGRLLPKCQILLTSGANCGTIMVEECTLVRGQTTRGGCFCGVSAAHPDYYTYEAAAGSRSISSRSRKQDVTRQQEPDYCQNLTHSRITICAHAAGQHHPDYQAAAPRPADYYPDHYPRLPCTRMQQDEKQGRRASTLRQP